MKFIRMYKKEEKRLRLGTETWFRRKHPIETYFKKNTVAGDIFP